MGKQGVDRRYKGEIEADVFSGPGYICYVVCLFGACMRALFHWLTPIPGEGSGCKPKLPRALRELLDEDGDGKVSWAEMKRAYPIIVEKRRQAAAEEQKKKEGDWAASKKNGSRMIKEQILREQLTERDMQVKRERAQSSRRTSTVWGMRAKSTDSSDGRNSPGVVGAQPQMSAEVQHDTSFFEDQGRLEEQRKRAPTFLPASEKMDL